MFNVSTTPFSTRGSYLLLTHPIRRKLSNGSSLPPGLYLCTVRGEADARDILRIEAITEEPVVERMTPVSLHLEAGDDRAVDIVFADPATLRIRCRGMGVRLERADWRPFDRIVQPVQDHWLLTAYLNRSQFALRRLEGALTVDAPWERVRCPSITIELRPDEKSGLGELSLSEYVGSWDLTEATKTPPDWETCHETQTRAWEAWLNRQPDAPADMHTARELAAYLTQSCTVAPAGYLTREAVLMSKFKMTNFWTWDNCFNVLGLAQSDPALAWDQFMLAYAHQSPTGQVPASFNNASLHWMDAKPPIHGWTLDCLLRADCAWLDDSHLREAYAPMAAFTEWWFRFRDHDGDGLPAAFHGNDTGWDNASVFDEGPLVTSPDLSACLVIQMEVLGEIARRTGRPEEAEVWKTRAKELLQRLIARLWDEERGQFISRMGGSDRIAPGDSLINFMPLVLGARLPEKIRTRLVAGLFREGRFLTDWGLATEAVDSPFYNAEGYWRGPIWAPPTLILWDGLRQGGFTREAALLRERYLALCTRAGFAENSHATEGRSLRDPTYTWTSSTFLYLLAQ